MSLEVAEHLTPARADSFVEDLTRLSDVILFSAAIPGQHGLNHVNEQWQFYWAEKFLQRDYIAVDCIRPKIWSNNSVEWWYCQNILVYVKRTELGHYPKLQEFYLNHRDAITLNLVHPKLYVWNILQFKKFYRQIQSQLTK